MSTSFNVKDDELTNLEKAIKAYPDNAEKKINAYLHGSGYDMFDKAIHNAMPESGRTWKKKKTAAKKAASLQDKDKNENLAVTVMARTAYNYLYFPNDGSNTEHHFGNQQFFERAVEMKTDEAVNDMLDLLQFDIKED